MLFYSIIMSQCQAENKGYCLPGNIDICMTFTGTRGNGRQIMAENILWKQSVTVAL
jgi:hypothetical protein